MDLVDLPRQIEILLRNPALAMGRKTDPHHVVIDGDIGVMPGAFGGLGDPVDELNSRQERWERKFLLKVFPLIGPPLYFR